MGNWKNAYGASDKIEKLSLQLGDAVEALRHLRTAAQDAIKLFGGHSGLEHALAVTSGYGDIYQRTHRLKIWPEYYKAVLDGSKKFEVRENDRGFRCGDMVVLQEFDTSINAYTGNEATFKIGYVHSIDAKRVAFSLLTV